MQKFVHPRSVHVLIFGLLIFAQKKLFFPLSFPPFYQFIFVTCKRLLWKMCKSLYTPISLFDDFLSSDICIEEFVFQNFLNGINKLYLSFFILSFYHIDAFKKSKWGAKVCTPPVISRFDNFLSMWGNVIFPFFYFLFLSVTKDRTRHVRKFVHPFYLQHFLRQISNCVQYSNSFWS